MSSLFFALSEVLISMRKCHKGQVVAISSLQGKLAIPFRSSYAASKHALQAFFDTLRAEAHEEDVSVLVVSPGYIRTNLSIKALTGDGSAYGVMDKTTESGMDPLEAARQILVAIIHKDSELILAPLIHRAAIILRTLFPLAFFLAMKFKAKSGRKRV